MIEFKGTIKDVIRRTTGVKSFRVGCPNDIAYNPGQYLFVRVIAEGCSIAKPLSFSSSPTEKGYIEFTKKITGSDFSRSLDSRKPGDNVGIKMPFGKFTFKGEYGKIALLSGGIGITPFRSIIKYTVDMSIPSDITLLYGNNTESDIIFRDDLEQMQADGPGVRIINTLTSKDIPADKWKGFRGYIDEDMIRKTMPDYGERVFFLCGPPSMVDSLKTILRDGLDIQDEHIKVEHFRGY